jgi:hypothetical protein
MPLRRKKAIIKKRIDQFHKDNVLTPAQSSMLKKLRINLEQTRKAIQAKNPIKAFLFKLLK